MTTVKEAKPYPLTSAYGWSGAMYAAPPPIDPSDQVADHRRTLTPPPPAFPRVWEQAAQEAPLNRVLDYNKLQGTYHPADLSTQIIRDVGYRHVTVQNSSYRPIGIGVTTYYSGTPPSIRFYVYPGETRHLGINSQGEAAQFMWPLDPATAQQVGKPQIFARDANDFVWRDGINGWFVQRYIRPSYRAAF